MLLNFPFKNSRFKVSTVVFYYRRSEQTLRIVNLLSVVNLVREGPLGTDFLTKNAPKFSPNFLSLHFVGPKDFPQISHPNFPPKNLKKSLTIIDLLMGLFRGAVFCDGGGARKQPIKQPTEMPTSIVALMGRFPSLMGRFLTLMGRFPDFVLRGRFAS